MRPCPRCSREIFDAAYECIYCGAYVRIDPPPFSPSAAPPPPIAWPEPTPPPPAREIAARPAPADAPAPPAPTAPRTPAPPPPPAPTPPAPPVAPAADPRVVPVRATPPRPPVVEAYTEVPFAPPPWPGPPPPLPIPPPEVPDRPLYRDGSVTVTRRWVTAGGKVFAMKELQVAKAQTAPLAGCGCLTAIAAGVAAFATFGAGAILWGTVFLAVAFLAARASVRSDFALRLFTRDGRSHDVARHASKDHLEEIARIINLAVDGEVDDASAPAGDGPPVELPSALPWEAPRS